MLFNMNQKEFVEKFSEEIEETKKWTHNTINSLFEFLSELLIDWQSVVFTNFWKFDSLIIQERKWVNPKTLEKIIIPKLNRVKFIPSKTLKSKLNK